MKSDPIPDTNHVSHYCGGSHVKPDGSISGVAFRLRDLNGKIEEYLSVNWLEFLRKDDRKSEIDEIRKIFSIKLNRLGSKSKIAVLNVGKTRSHVKRNSEDRRILQVLHEPEKSIDESHSGIHGYRLEDIMIADLIAQSIQEVHPSKPENL